MNEKDMIASNGIVVFLRDNIYSKSEAVFPFLYCGNGLMKKIYYTDDNPFVNGKLKDFDSQKVEVSGYMDGNVFVIMKIQPLTEVIDKIENIKESNEHEK